MSTGFHGHSGVFVRLKKFADTGLCIGHLGSLQFTGPAVKAVAEKRSPGDPPPVPGAGFHLISYPDAEIILASVPARDHGVVIGNAVICKPGPGI
jgi:hypothetical protein